MTNPSFGPIAPHYDQLMAAVPYRMWVEYLKLLLVRQENPTMDLLDVCCGTGTMAEMLVQDSYTVSGFDLSAQMIEKAKQKAEQLGLDIAYFVADARSFELPRRYGCAYSFFDSLNYIAELDGFRSAIQAIANHLEPEGSLIFDLNTAFAFEAEMFTQQDLRKRTDLKYDWQGHYDSDTRVITVTMDFWKGGQHWTETHVQRAHSDAEVRDALSDAGFSQIEAYESYTLRKPRKMSDRIHYCARYLP
ncbi:MAG: methyltransferase domain-containing protein [Chthonomonas sp.]|nr:methyltransferase domain-containing protein [Chthonomonas sp.]